MPRIFSQVLNNWLDNNNLKTDHPILNKEKSSVISLKDWEECVRQVTADIPITAVGFDIGRSIQLSNLGALGYLVANSQNLSELLAMYRLFEKRFYGYGWGEMTSSADKFHLSWDTRYTQFDRIIEQIHSIVLVDFISAMCPDAGRPLRVSITNCENNERQYYENAFSCPVDFSSDSMSITYPNYALQSPVLLHNPLADLYKNEQPTSLLKDIANTAPFIFQVQKEILHQLPCGARIESIANALNISRRSLQRRLSERQCRYSELLDGIRENRADKLLKDPHLNLSEVAFLLGYSEQSAFNHAYKRWSGLSPRQNVNEIMNSVNIKHL